MKIGGVTIGSSVIGHPGLVDLGVGDPHVQYLFLASRVGGQALEGNNLGNTFPSISNGLALTNSTAATSGAPIQQSPPLTFKGSAWDTDDAVSRNVQFSMAAGSAGAGATPNRRLSIFDGSLTGTPLTVSVAYAGSGYAPLDKIYLVEPGNTTNLEYVEALTVGGSGEVLTISPPYTPSAGSSSLYTVGIKTTTSSGAGINCAINVSALVSELYRFNQFGGFILSPQSSYRKTQIYNGSAWFLDNNPTIGPYMRLVSGSIAVSIYLTGRDHFLGGDKFLIANQANAPLLTIDPVTGNAGFGTLTPGSKLSVVGLPTYANETAALGAGLVSGDFYCTGGDPNLVAVVS